VGICAVLNNGARRNDVVQVAVELLAAGAGEVQGAAGIIDGIGTDGRNGVHGQDAVAECGCAEIAVEAGQAQFARAEFGQSAHTGHGAVKRQGCGAVGHVDNGVGVERGAAVRAGNVAGITQRAAVEDQGTGVGGGSADGAGDGTVRDRENFQNPAAQCGGARVGVGGEYGQCARIGLRESGCLAADAAVASEYIIQSAIHDDGSRADKIGNGYVRVIGGGIVKARVVARKEEIGRAGATVHPVGGVVRVPDIVGAVAHPGEIRVGPEAGGDDQIDGFVGDAVGQNAGGAGDGEIADVAIEGAIMNQGIRGAGGHTAGNIHRIDAAGGQRAGDINHVAGNIEMVYGPVRFNDIIVETESACDVIAARINDAIGCDRHCTTHRTKTAKNLEWLNRVTCLRNIENSAGTDDDGLTGEGADRAGNVIGPQRKRALFDISDARIGVGSVHRQGASAGFNQAAGSA